MDKLNTLIIKRFCGEECYPLQNGTWSIDDNELSIEMNFGPGTNLHEDTAYLEEEPGWNLYFDTTNVTNESVKSGLILNEANEDETYIYYCECMSTFENHLEILERKGDDILVKVTGECCDINYYDGSKGNDILEVTAWISKE